MTSITEPAYILVSQPINFESQKEEKLKADIEHGNIAKKIDSLQTLIIMMSNSESISKQLLMFVIRFLIPCQDKRIKKLLLLFWEMVPKYGPDGHLIHEMILVCDAYRKDLQHPNEYVRGAILRFLCKLKEPKILSPILPSIRSCLEHAHPYVRRNAVLAIFTIYKNFNDLLPDAPDLIETFLEKESDSSCQRNAFMMLIHSDENRAINYLRMKVSSVLNFEDVLQLSIIELIYNYCLVHHEQSSLLKYLYQLLGSKSRAVSFASANALVALSDSTAAFEYSIKCYVNLILKESDNNVRLVILDCLWKVYEIKKYNRILNSIIPDLLNVLSSGGSDHIVDIEVARKILNLLQNILSDDAVENVITFFRKEIQRIQKRYTQATDTKQLTASNKEVLIYHKLLIKFIKTCCISFDSHLRTIIPILMRTLSSVHTSVAREILELIRASIMLKPEIQPIVFIELHKILARISDPEIFRSALWITTTCISCHQDIEHLVNTLYTIVVNANSTSCSLSASATEREGDCTAKRLNLISADGTYLSQASSLQPNITATDMPVSFISTNDTFIGSSVSNILLKLATLYKTYQTSLGDINLLTAKCISIIVTFLKSAAYSTTMKNPNIIRTYSILQIFTENTSTHALNDFLTATVLSANEYVAYEKSVILSNEVSISAKIDEKHDTEWGISFSSIINACSVVKKENVLDTSLAAAVGHVSVVVDQGVPNKVIPLTGISDPIYAETYIRVENLDVYFDVLIVNQTADYVQNVSLELRTIGEYKILSRNQPLALPSLKFGNIQTIMRINSGSDNIIFGVITYETTGNKRDCFSVVLDEIKLDITETESAHFCTAEEFQQMWLEFEWENKVSISTDSTDFAQVMETLMNATKMTRVTPIESESECAYMVANFYTKNRFGDEAVANLSLERSASPSSINGHCRIRSKTQSMAVLLGKHFNRCFKRF